VGTIILTHHTTQALAATPRFKYGHGTTALIVLTTTRRHLPLLRNRLQERVSVAARVPEAQPRERTLKPQPLQWGRRGGGVDANEGSSAPAESTGRSDGADGSNAGLRTLKDGL